MLKKFLETSFLLSQIVSGWLCKVEIDSLILSPSLEGKKILWNLLSKKTVVTFFYNLRCCKTMQLEIGGLARKIVLFAAYSKSSVTLKGGQHIFKSYSMLFQQNNK